MEKFTHQEIYLGFPETPSKGDFNYENFPSKIGGKPVWLYPPMDLESKFFKCDTCGRNLFFLLQCYCPLEEYTHSFHRVIYLFFCHMCWKSSNTIKSLRLQLKENNEFYLKENLLNSFDEEIIENINKNLRFLKDEFNIITDIESNKAKKIYYNFYEKIDAKVKNTKNNDSNSNLNSHYNPEEFEGIEVDEIIPDMNIDDGKVNNIMQTYLKDEGITEDQVN
jgi:hypothetical protein